MAASRPRLADRAPQRDRLLFVAARPSPESVAAGRHLQGPGEVHLWRWLAAATIVPDGADPAVAETALLDAGHGLATLDPTAVPDGQADHGDDLLRAGVGALWQRVAIWRPAAIVFVDRGAAEAAAGRELAEPWGALDGVALAGRPAFLVPPPSADGEVVATAVNFLRNLLTVLPRS